MVDVLVPFAMLLLVLGIWITPIVLGIRAARRNNRSPHWMWFGIHPFGGWIAFVLLAALPPLRRCPRCGEKSRMQAWMCPYCLMPLTPDGQLPNPRPSEAAPPALAHRPSPANLQARLRTNLLIGRVMVVFLTFVLVLVYASVFITAVLQGDPRGYLAGFAAVPFREPFVRILLVISAVTFLGAVAGSTWYFHSPRPKPASAPVTNLIVLLVASALLETLAIYGLVLGFAIGPKVATLSLALQAATVLGGALIFPTSKAWLRGVPSVEGP